MSDKEKASVVNRGFFVCLVLYGHQPDVIE